MVKTNSMYLELGTFLPDFEMQNINSLNREYFNFSQLDHRHLLLIFICAHCPFVKYLESEITKFSKNIEDKVQTIAISSNDISTHPLDAPEYLSNQAKSNKWSFPYLFDKDQSFAKKLKAACTPDFYLFANLDNKNFSLFYHGQFDGSRPSNDIPITGKDLYSAIKDIKENYANYPSPQIPSLGCNIKWTPGKEPDWFR